MLLGEAVAVHVVLDVDPAARVGVLEPGAAHIGVLLEHGHLHTGLLQAMRGGDTRHTRPHHHHMEVALRCQCCLAPLRGAQRIAIEGQLLEEQRHVAI